jgi:carboxylesterase
MAWGLVIAALAVTVYDIIIFVGMVYQRARQPADPDTGIIKGAHPVYLEGKNGKAVLMLHGYIGSPTDLGRLPELLNREGFSVSVPLLPGHGRDPRDFAKTKPSDFVHFANTEYRRLRANHSTVIVVGFSMGGAIAAILAEGRKPGGLVLLAPYFQIKHEWYYLLPTEYWNWLLTPVIPYVYRLPAFRRIRNKAAIPKLAGYDYIAMRGARAAIALQRRAAKAALHIRVPTLIVHSTEDRATDYRASEKLAKCLPAGMAEFLQVQNSDHMLMWDFERDKVERKVVEFVRSIQ